MGKLKFAGFPLCAARIALSAYIMINGYGFGDGYTGPVLIACYALGLFTTCGIRGAKDAKTEVNGR